MPDADLIEYNGDSYTVKTATCTPGQKIHCPHDNLTFEKVDENSVKVTFPKGMKVTKV